MLQQFGLGFLDLSGKRTQVDDIVEETREVIEQLTK